MLIHKHRDFPSDMFTIMCGVGATIMIGKIENGSLYLRNRKQYPCFYTCSYRNTRVQKFGRTGNNQRETIQYGEFFLFILWVLLNYLKCFCHRWLSWGVVHLLWGTNYVYSNDDWTVEYFDVPILDRGSLSGERRVCRQLIKKRNTRYLHNAKFPLVKINMPVNQIWYVLIML
jgi:hypothetical protein